MEQCENCKYCDIKQTTSFPISDEVLFRCVSMSCWVLPTETHDCYTRK